MSDWPEVRLSDLAYIDIGGTPSRAIPALWAEKPGGYPWISIADLRGKYVRETKEHISALGVRSSNVKLIPEQTTVMSFKLTVGRAAITAREMFCNEAIAIFRPKDDRLNGKWLYHALPGVAGRVVTDTAVKGATLNKAKMADMRLELPLPAEQAKIAEILDTCDAIIQKTEALIDNLKAIKQGLLHDLLTRGIDANGRLRPPQAEAPHLYKKSSLGWIPKDWYAGGLAKVASSHRAVIRTGPFGSSLKGEHWRERGTPVVTIGSLGDGAFIPSELLFVDEATAVRLADFSLVPGDLVFSRVADVGRSVVVSENERGWIMSSNFMRISCDRERARPEFIQALLSSSHLVRRQLRTMVNSGGRDVANSSILLGLSFQWPSLAEQDIILSRVRAIDELLKAEGVDLQKQLIAKTALMDDLLTGRVRVTPLLAQQPTERSA